MSEQGTERREDATSPAPPRGWRLVDFDRLSQPPTALAAFAYLVATLFALAVLVLVVFGLFASFHIAYESAVGDFKDRIEAAKVFFPILLALVGGPLLIWRVITAHVQAQATRHQAETGREAHYTTLFTKAVEQLGATRDVSDPNVYVKGKLQGGEIKHETVTKTEPNLEVRLGAIYALERIAKDSARDHWPIMEVLCAYLRNPQNSGVPWPKPDNPDLAGIWLDQAPEPRTDIQAALTVIGRRPTERIKQEREAGHVLDFSGANLQNAVLAGGNFSNVRMIKGNLAGADCTLTRLEGSHLEEVDLTSASLLGIHLERARLSSVVFDNVSFRDCHLSEARFSVCSLKHADFESAELDCADFGSQPLEGALLFGADFSTVRNVITEHFEGALGDATTKLPSGLEAPREWPARELSRFERARHLMPKRVDA